MDADALAERILKDLDSIFSKDPFIVEVEVVPLEECVQNKCPVIHVDHQVAIESWCIKHVYQYAYKRLLDWRSRPHKLEPSVLLSWTRAVLIINPDVQLAWNVRKELVGNQKQDIKDELQFSSVVLSRKPKCSEIFAHRHWLLEQQMNKAGWTGLPADPLNTEMQICQKAASKYQHNYYAWSHRIWVVQKAAIPTQKLVLEELQRTENWVESHISDHSGFQFRQFLYSWWMKECRLSILPGHCHPLPQNPPPSWDKHSSEQPTELVPSLLREMGINSELILFYGGHEALWYHRRFILHMLGNLICNESLEVPNHKADGNLTQKAKRNKLDVCIGQVGLGSHETAFMLECEQKCSNDARQLQMIERHREWMQKVFAISLPNYH